MTRTVQKERWDYWSWHYWPSHCRPFAASGVVGLCLEPHSATSAQLCRFPGRTGADVQLPPDLRLGRRCADADDPDHLDVAYASPYCDCASDGLT